MIRGVPLMLSEREKSLIALAVAHAVQLFERFQEVATDSARYFESVSRYLGFAPEPFAFNLLTRSGRIGHNNLTARDPAQFWTSGQWMTEITGGSDVGLTQTVARKTPEGWRFRSRRHELNPSPAG